MSDPVVRLVEFGRALRAEGLTAGTGEIEAFCRAAALLPAEDLYWAGRATLAAGREDIPPYDRVFRSFFGGGAEQSPQRRPPARLAFAGAAGDEEAGGHDDADRPRLQVGLASPIELLRHKSFAACSSDELAQLAELMAQLRLAPQRRSRRRRSARTGELDLRRTVRRALRTGGDPSLLARRTRRLQPRRIVLLLDVSGSMTSYSRALLVFAHAALRRERRCEAFCFGTRLTRLTGAFATSDPDEALRRASAEVVDWEGGTRIGESIKTFLDRYGQAGLARGSVFIVCSDGLETGDPFALGEQMERLSRLAHLVVWLNPLKEDPAYEPLARGMAAALPHIDLFAGGHNLASIEEVAAALDATRRTRAPAGRA